MRNHYKILGIRENASPERIKEAYRRRALETHPDRTGEDARDEFLKVQAAYETLSNPRDRARFDRQLKQQRRRARSGRVHARNGQRGRTRQRRRRGIHQVRRRGRSSRFASGQRSGRMLDPSDLPPGTLKYSMLALGIMAISYGLFGPALVVLLILSVIGIVSLVCIVDILDDVVLGGRLKDLF